MNCPRCGELKRTGWRRCCHPHLADMTDAEEKAANILWAEECGWAFCVTCHSKMDPFRGGFILSRE